MKKKLGSKIISAALAMVLTFTGTCGTAIAANAASVDYISKIKLVNSAKFNEDEYVGKGWKVADGEINSVGSEKKKIVYQTTKNRFNAITDIRLMNENGAFSAEMFQEAMKSQSTNVAQMVNEWEVIVNEFKKNYKAGKTPAVYAKKLLDFYAEDDSCDMKANKIVTVGDILVKDTYDKATMTKILLEGNSKMVALIEEALVIGCSEVMPTEEELDALAERADYTVDMEPTWLFKAQSLSFDPDGFKTDKAEIAAMILKTSDSIKTILKNYEALASRANNARMSVDDFLAIEAKAVEEEIAENKNYNETTGMYDVQKELAVDSVAKDMYDVLSVLYYNDNGDDITFADLFMKDNLKTYDFLPLANALTDGQARLLYYVGLEDLIRYSDRTEVEWKASMDVRIKETADLIKGASENMGDISEELANLTEAEKDDAEVKSDLLVKANKMSVYAGVNRAMFDQELAKEGLIVLTSDAMRKAASSGDQSWTTSNTVAENKVDIASTTILAVGAATLATAGSILIRASKNIVKKIGVKVAGGSNSIVQTVYAVRIIPDVGRQIGAKVLGITLIGVSVALLAWDIYNLVVALTSKPTPVHSSIPLIIVNHVDTARVGLQDMEINKFIAYEVVTNENDKPSNINDNSVPEWYCMYVTKDQEAGNPILADDVAIGELSASNVQKAADAEEKNKSFVSVKDFGRQGSANLSRLIPKNGNKEATPCYVYFKADITDLNKNSGSAFSTGRYAIVAVVSALAGAGITFLITRRKKEQTA